MRYRALNLLYVFLIISAFVLCGCSSSKNTDQIALNSDFSADFSACFKDMKLEGKLSFNSHKLLNIKISSPNSLEGLEVSYKSSQMEIKRDDMICSADEAYIPQSSFPDMLKEILWTVAEGRMTFLEEKDEISTYAIITALGNARIYADSKGRLVGASLKDKGFEISFNNIMK